MTDTRASPKLLRLAALIRESPHNLVSRHAREELLDRHIPESQMLAQQLPRSERPLRLLDVGSGGGLPGLVIAVERPDIEVHLLDARQKKVDFLREAASVLELKVSVHHGRAEDLLRGALGGSFDLVTARAVAPLERLIAWTVPFLRPGGLLFAVKGDRWAEELQAAEAELLKVGARVVETPEADGGHQVAPKLVIVARSSPVEQHERT